MPIPISWPVIGGVPYLVPQTGETNWGALTNYLVALSSAQGTTAQKFGTRVAVSTPILITSATDCVIIVNLTVPGPSTVTLPIGVQGQFFIVADGKGDAGLNNITVLPQLGDTINGDPSFVINANDDSITLVFDGISNWKVTSQILSFTPGVIARSAIQAGNPGWVVTNDGTTGLLSEEQFLNQIRGGFGTNVAGFTGVVKSNLGSFSASLLVDADVSPTANIDATKIGTGIVNNTEFNRLNEIGLLYNTTKVSGGNGSINGGNPALFDVAAGTGKITVYTGSPETPVITDVSYGPFTAQTVTNLATADITYVSVNSSGALVQQTSIPTPAEQRTNIYLFRINHTNRVNISFIDNIGDVAQSLGNQYGDLIDALGPFNITGNVVSPNGVNLSFNKSAGEMFSRYFNQSTTPLNPHYASTAATAPTTFQYRTQSTAFVGANTTLIDPLNYDVGGVVTLVPGGGATSTIQRVYLFPSNNIRVQYGQNIYANLADAVAAVGTETFVINPTNVGFPILIAYIVVQKNCLNLSAATCRILQAPRFDAGAAGGSGGTSTIQGAYNNSIAPILVLAASPGPFNIRDASVPLGTSLFNVQNNAAAVSYIDVSTQGIKSNQYPTANRVMVTDANSAASQSAVTSTEVGFLSGTVGVTGTVNLVRSTSPVINTPDIDGGTASNTARVTIPKAPYATLLGLTRKEGTILYATDLDQFLADDGITLNPLGTGPGLNTNLIRTPNNATGWSETGAVFATPVTTTTAADLPLGGIVSSAIQFVATGSAAESGTYNSYSFTTSATMNGKLQVDFFMRPGSGFATSEWTVSVYAGAVRQTLETDSGGFTFLPNATTRFTTSFDAIASTAYTLRFARTSGAGSATLNVTNVFTGWPFVSSIAPVGPWQSYTPAWTGGSPAIGNGTLGGRWRQVGSNMEVQVSVSSGTTTTYGGTAWLFGIPSGFTIDTTALSRAGTVPLGTAKSESLTTFFTGVVLYSTTTTVLAVSSGAGSQWGNATPFTPTASTANQRWEFQFFVPIAEWAGAVSTAPVPAEEFVFNSSTATGTGDTTSFAYGPQGALIQNITTDFSRRVRFQYPIQNEDEIDVEVSEDRVKWYSIKLPFRNAAASYNIIPWQLQNAAGYGLGRITQVNSTDIDISFGTYSAANGATYAAAGQAWSAGGGAAYWRVRKTKKSALPFRNAGTDGSSGLVAPYNNSSIVHGARYTPTLAASTNVAAAVGLSSHYSRNGKIVTVSGVCTVNTTAAANTASVFFIPLPIPSNLSAFEDAAGTFTKSAAGGTGFSSGYIFADTTPSNNRVTVNFNSVASGNNNCSFQFQYEIK